MTRREEVITTLLERRAEIITTLLERYQELVEPLNGPSGIAGDGDSVSLMPRTYTPSVRELERLLVRLRDERHNIWWHVNERYLSVRITTAWFCPKCHGVSHAAFHHHRDKRGRPSRYDGRRVSRVVWNQRVDKAKVKKGLGWLASEWALPHEPMLPDEIRVAA